MTLAGEWEIKQRNEAGIESEPGTTPVNIDSDTLRRLAEAFPEVVDENKLREACARRGGVTTADLLANAAAAAKQAGR